MPHDLLCAMDLPVAHPLWQILRDLEYAVHRIADSQQLVSLAATGVGQAALVGPNLPPHKVAGLAGRLEKVGLPMLLVLPPGCTGPPVSVASPVYGYLPEDSGPGQVAATLTAAIQVFRYVVYLGTRLQRLEVDWEERKVVERAKGVLMARQGVSEEEAHRLLRENSMRLRQRMAQTARTILTGSLVVS